MAGASLLYSWKYHLKVSKFQSNQNKLLRFFLFYDVHIAKSVI